MSSAKNQKKISQELLLMAVKKKRECNARAQAIVESLLEQKNDSSEFLLKLRNITKDHYEDIVDERNILRLCGYPLCENELQNIPKQQYRIYTGINRVYDITDRKKFCSDQCFSASEYIKAQILTSELWQRGKEDNQEFKLLNTNES